MLGNASKTAIDEPTLRTDGRLKSGSARVEAEGESSADGVVAGAERDVPGRGARIADGALKCTCFEDGTAPAPAASISTILTAVSAA